MIRAARESKREPSRERAPRAGEPALAIDGGRGGASTVRHERAVLALSGVAEAREDVFVGEIRKIGEYLLLGHPGCEVRQDVVDSDSHPADARLTAAFAFLDGNDSFVGHPRHFTRLTTENGSTRAPWTRMPKCRCGAVTRPVAPTSPTIWPFFTVSQAWTSIRDRCA